MRRLFYGDVPGDDPWRHLMRNGEFDSFACRALLDEYIDADVVLVHGGTLASSIECTKGEAVAHIAELIKKCRVRVADPRFHSRILIDPIGVGKGSSSRNSRI
jgi:hypothetical protein